MALTRTTLAAAVAAIDGSITVASATSIAAGSIIKVNGETMKVRKDYVSGTSIPVLRGLDGSVVAAHAITSGVVHSATASDFGGPPAQAGASVSGPIQRARTISAYGAAGAITLPAPGSDAVAIINGTAALAMTLANPLKDNDGDILIVVGNGKGGAHTVTYTAGLGDGGSGLDVMTFDVGAQCSVMFIAANSIWVPLPSPLSGTLTGCDVAVA